MLLAQAAAPAIAPNSSFAVFVVIGGLGFAAVLVLILVLSFRHARRSREMLHEERLMAVKQGQTLEEPNSSHGKFMHNAFWISFWLVALVPGAAFSAAASATEGERPVYLVLAVWLCAGAASIAAAVCATVLLLFSRRRAGIGVSSRGQGKTEEEMYA